MIATPASAYRFRPPVIQPLHGIVSRTKLHRGCYAARRGAPKPLLETRDVDALAAEDARAGTAAGR